MESESVRELCEVCDALECTVCGHEACFCCVDCCDDPDCLGIGLDGTLQKTHACIFPACPNGCDRGAIARAVSERGVP
jgi:hypothetical protein